MKRFPNKQEMINSTLTVLTIVNFWAMIVFFYNFPGLIKQITLGDLGAVLGYVLLSALIESLVISLILITLSFLLPAKLLRANFSVRTLVLLLLAVIYIIPFHVYIPRISILMFDAGVSIFIIIWSFLFLVELVLFHKIIPTYPNFTSAAKKIIERFSVLGTIYLFLDLIAGCYVVIANWS